MYLSGEIIQVHISPFAFGVTKKKKKRRIFSLGKQISTLRVAPNFLVIQLAQLKYRIKSPSESIKGYKNCEMFGKIKDKSKAF